MQQIHKKVQSLTVGVTLFLPPTRPTPTPTPQPRPVPKAGPTLPRSLNLSSGSFQIKPLSSSLPFIFTRLMVSLSPKEKTELLGF